MTNSLLEKYFSAISHIIPQKETVSSLGLDIGVDSCKVVETVKTGDGYQVINWGIEPIENADTQGSVKKLLSRLKIQSKSPNTAVFGKGTLIRYIEMPRMSMEDLKKSFDIEADKYFPFARDQIYTSCYILDPVAKDKQMSVLVAAVKKEIINERMELIFNLGLQPNFITLNPIAIANVFYSSGEENPKNKTVKEGIVPSATAVLDIGETVSSLVIMIDNLPRFTRDIFLGGQDFTKKISNALGISLAEARKLKYQPGDRAQEILSLCDSTLMNLASEVRLSFDYFMTERNIPVTKLFLTGGASTLSGLLELFSKSLDISIEKWNPIVSLKISNVLDDDFNKNINRLGVALGLALYHHA